MMRIPSSPSPLATFLLLTSGATLSHAGMAAWFTDFGPQVILQNDTTGAIHYTTCNSDGEPTYSPDNIFELVAYPPKNNTGLAGSGYKTDKQTVASIYYMDENDVIVNALFNCNMRTGRFEFFDNWVISGVAPVPLSPDSGLAVLLMGNTEGYRVYYHDEDMAVNELAYKPGDQWKYNGLISQDLQSGSAIAAAKSGNNNITVVTARDSENIGVTRYHADTTWRISTFPHPLAGNLTTQDTSRENITIDKDIRANFTLPSWNGKPRGMAISIDPKRTRSVWYIGEDKQLYHVANKNWTWSHQNSQTSDIWPPADIPGAPLAAASNFDKGEFRIYYLVNGSIAEIKNAGGEDGWEKWTTLPPPEPVKAEQPVSPPPTPSSTPAIENDETSGLSTGAKIGLGLGISLGVLSIILVLTACFLLRRGRNPNNRGHTQSSNNSYEAGGGYQDGSYKPIGSSSGGTGAFQSPLHSSYGVPPGSAPSPQGSWGAAAAAAASVGHGYDHYAWEKKLAGELPPANTAGIYQLDATGRPVELDSSRVVYELSDQPYAHELMGEGHHHISNTGTTTTTTGGGLNIQRQGYPTNK